MTRKKLSPEELTLRNVARQAEKALAELPERQATINAMVGALTKNTTSIKLREDGTIVVKREGKRSKTVRPNAAAMRKRTVFAQPTAASLSTARTQGTIEQQLISDLEDALPDAARPVAKLITQTAFKGCWVLAQHQEERLIGALGRKLPQGMRPEMAELLGYAEQVGGRDLMKKVRQYLSTTPSLFRFVDADAIIDAALENESLNALVKEHGGTKALRHLSPNAVPLVAPNTVETICQALAIGASTGDLQKGGKQSKWLKGVLPALLSPDAPVGFFDWLVTRTLQNPGLQVDAVDLLRWAGMPESTWNQTITLVEAALRAERHREKEKRVGKSAVPLPDIVDEWVAPDESVVIRQPATNLEMFEWGEAMGNCLRGWNAHFTRCMCERRTLVVGIFQVLKDHQKLTSTAEIQIKDGRMDYVLQHEKARAGAPTKRDREALALYLHQHQEGAA